jgi:hypothetical protein
MAQNGMSSKYAYYEAKNREGKWGVVIVGTDGLEVSQAHSFTLDDETTAADLISQMLIEDRTTDIYSGITNQY